MVTQKAQKAQKFEPKGSWLRNITQEKFSVISVISV